MSWVPAAIMGGASLAGGILGNAASAKQATRMMRFQREMANTQHQREVKDLRAAGLNPILSATGGPGAAVPSGSAAPQEDVISPAINSAMQMFKTIMDQNLVQASAQREANTALKLLAEANLLPLQGKYLQAQTDQAASAAGLMQEQEKAEQYKNRVQLALWDNPEMGNLIRKNFMLDYLIKKGDKEMIEREAARMKAYGEMDNSQYGKVLLFLERLFGGVLKGRSMGYSR